VLFRSVLGAAVQVDVERHQRLSGAVAVGARKPLVAFNVYLDGGAEDEDAAKAIAKAVRETSGGLKNVRAIGFFVPERDCVTVSMNLVDTDATPVYRAFELVRVEASRYGLTVLDTEIVGLAPQAAISETAQHYLQLKGFEANEQILENLIERAESGTNDAGPSDPQPEASNDAITPERAKEPNEPAGGIGGETVGGFLDTVASDAPTPGGGSVAAICGAAGAALIAMVARLTIGKKGFEDVSERMEEIVSHVDDSRAALIALADRDAAAFEGVMAAIRLPKATDEEKAARSEALQRATEDAAAAPMEVARRSTPLLEVAIEVIEKGNPNAASDGLSAAAVLHASVTAALANVEINLASLKDQDAVAKMRQEGDALRAHALEGFAAAAEAFRSRLAG